MLIRLPPRTSHILQPLDVGYFGPMKQTLNKLKQILGGKVVIDFMLDKIGITIRDGQKKESLKTISTSNLLRLLGEARPTKTSAMVKAAFKTAGVYPLRSYVVNKHLESVHFKSRDTELFIDFLETDHFSPQKPMNRALPPFEVFAQAVRLSSKQQQQLREELSEECFQDENNKNFFTVSCPKSKITEAAVAESLAHTGVLASKQVYGKKPESHTHIQIIPNCSTASASNRRLGAMNALCTSSLSWWWHATVLLSSVPQLRQMSRCWI